MNTNRIPQFPPFPRKLRAQLEAVVPLLALVISMGFFAAVAMWEQGDIEREAQKQMQDRADRLGGEVSRRITSTIYALNGAKAYFGINPNVNRTAFKTYVASHEMSNEFPAVRGFSFVQRVMRSELNRFVMDSQMDGSPTFALHQLSQANHDDLYIVKFIEPAATNAGALGLDIGSDPLRRSTLQQAIDSGQPAMSAPISLVQNEQPTPGILLMVPVYANGAHPSNVEERRAAARGLLVAPVVVSEALAEMPEITPNLFHLKIFDVTAESSSQPIYNSSDNSAEVHRYTAHTMLPILGRQWELSVMSEGKFNAGIDHSMPVLILATGAMISGMLGLYLYRGRQQYSRVTQMVNERTQELERERLVSDANHRANQQALEATVAAMNEAQRIGRVGTFVTDLQTGQWEGSAALYDILGIDATLPKTLATWNSLVAPAFRQRLLDYYAQVLASNGRFHMEYQVIRPVDGKICWVEGRGECSFDDTGNATSFRGTIRDINKRKLTQIELIEHQSHLEELVRQKTLAAESANLAKSEFLANMSHEIRTPMNGVIGMLDVLLKTPLLPEQKRMLTTIANSSQSLLNILNDILDYSKIEAGKLEVERIPTSLKEIAASVVELMQGVANSKGLAVSVSMAVELPDAIYSDPTRLSQVLLNLLGNAIKFTRLDSVHAGSVTLVLEPGTLPDGQPAVLLKVCDKGIGMSAEVVSNLFRPFAQAEVGTARQFGGTGLGLSITHRLVVLMGGRITVRSTLGEGSEFIVALPLQEARIEVRANQHSQEQLLLRDMAPSMEEAAAKGQLILLAEDDETNREVLGEQLRLLGYCADMAEDGWLAWRKWRSGHYALLMTDFHMPHMDGLELTKAIRKAEAPGSRLPIIAITANAMQGDAERCLEAGMDDFLSKPLRLLELSQMLAKWLPLPAVVDRGEDGSERAPKSTAEQVLTERSTGTVELWSRNALSQLVGDNPAMHQRLLEKFLTNARQHVNSIEEALLAGEAHNAANLAHKLKSASRSVGAIALGEMCQQIETAGFDADAARCAEVAAMLAPTLVQTHSLIVAEYGGINDSTV